MEAYDSSGLEAQLAKANLNPLAGRVRTPDTAYSRNKIIENSHGTKMKPRTPMRDVGADLASELAQMRVNMVQSRVQAETSLWGPSEPTAEDAEVLMGRGAGGGGPLDSFLDSSVRAADMEQARIDAGSSPLAKATAKYKEEVAKMRSRLANAKAEAADSRNSSSQLALGGSVEKLMLTNGFDHGRLSFDRSYEDSEEGGDYHGVPDSIGARWAKWGSPSARGTPAARGNASRGHKLDRSLRESWEDLHNGPMSRREAAERPGNHGAPSLENASDAAQRLARHLQTDENGIPESLRLNSALHSWRQLEAVAELCRSVPGILEISLADNNLGVDSAAAVAKVLRAAAQSLVALDLSNNALKLKAMQVISSEFGAGSGVQQLFLGGNPLGDKSLHVLSSSLQGGRALLHLDLSRADLTFAAAEPLGELFATAPSLRILDLSWNRLGGRGGRALARALTLAGQDHGRRGLGLASLRLAHTGLGDDGAAHIVLSLLQNHSLEELDLGSTKAGLATCKSLAYVLEPRNGASSSLARLGLTDNPLGCNGAAVLLRAVAQPGCRLEELALEQASFLDVGVHDGLKTPRRLSDDSKSKATAAGKAAALRRTESSKDSSTKSSAAQSASSARLPSAGRRRPMSAMSPGLQATAAAGPDTAAAAIKEVELQPGSFQLELEEAASRLCVLQLLDAVADGSADLRRVNLNGKRVARQYGWETWRTEMPDAGVLELEMVRLQGSDSPYSDDGQGLMVPVAPQLEGPRGSRSGAEVLPIRQDFIENMCGMLEVVGPLDEWRLQLVRMMCCAGLRATAQQALQLTMSFGESMGRERGQAAGYLVENVGIYQAGMLLGTLEEILMPSEVEEAKAGMERLLDAARRAAEAAQEDSEDDSDDEEDSLGLVVRQVEKKPPPVPQKPKAAAPSGFGVRERTMSNGRNTDNKGSSAKPPTPKKAAAAHLSPPAAKLRSRRASGGEEDGRKPAAAKPLGKAPRRSSSGATKTATSASAAAGGSSKKIASRRASNAGSSDSDASRVHLFAGLLDSPFSAAKSAAADAAAMDRYHRDGAGYDDPLNRTYSSSLTDDSRTEYRPQASTVSPDVSMQAAEFLSAKHVGSMMPRSAFDDRFEE